MNLLYVAISNNKMDGVNKKILSQYKTLKSLNSSSTTRLILAVFGTPSPEFVQAFPPDAAFLSLVQQDSLIQIVKNRLCLWSKVGKILSHVQEPTVVYLRYPFADPFLFFFLCKIKNNPLIKVITEHQTKEIKELKLLGLWSRFFSEYFWGIACRKKIDGFVGVTKEICDYQLHVCGDQKRPCLINGNGIEVNAVPIRTPPKYEGKRLDLIAMASFSPWHALDRLVEGVSRYRGSLQIYLHLVGHGKSLEAIKDLAQHRGVLDRIIFHGFLATSDLDFLFNYCHIAIGQLGVHRKGLEEVSSLKAREYCARGIPFVSSASDVDFPQDFPFHMQIPSNENPVDIEEVVGFAERILKVEDHPFLMRSYAERKLDWKVKMQKLIEFLELVQSKS